MNVRNFIERFKACPICKNDNHDDYLMNFFYDPSLNNLKKQLIRGLSVEKKNLQIGIPCCECFTKIFGTPPLNNGNFYNYCNYPRFEFSRLQLRVIKQIKVVYNSRTETEDEHFVRLCCSSESNDDFILYVDRTLNRFLEVLLSLEPDIAYNLNNKLFDFSGEECKLKGYLKVLQSLKQEQKIYINSSIRFRGSDFLRFLDFTLIPLRRFFFDTRRSKLLNSFKIVFISETRFMLLASPFYAPLDALLKAILYVSNKNKRFGYPKKVFLPKRFRTPAVLTNVGILFRKPPTGNKFSLKGNGYFLEQDLRETIKNFCSGKLSLDDALFWTMAWTDPSCFESYVFNHRCSCCGAKLTREDEKLLSTYYDYESRYLDPVSEQELRLYCCSCFKKFKRKYKLLDPPESKALRRLEKKIGKKIPLLLSYKNGKVGVTVGEETVMSLCLDNCQLNEFPREVFEFDWLSKLSLKNNNIKRIPSKICKFINLDYLILSHNKIESIPYSLKYLQGLYYFDASFNEIKKIPLFFGRFDLLRYLNLNYNKISSIPKSFGKNSSICNLQLYHNCLTKLPLHLPNNLKYLDLGYNRISVVSEEFENKFHKELKAFSMAEVNTRGNKLESNYVAGKYVQYMFLRMETTD